MEPDDMAFLEISGGDDSLLPMQQIPNDDTSSLSKTYFTCSPLQIPRSNNSFHPPPPFLVSPIAVNQKEEKQNSSSHRDSVNKENTYMNKPEVPKLGMEPHQMKRKKKGGGYNLRKSLAWDRAFLTDEGVLNPLELSLISGNVGKSSGDMLSVIHEDRRESLAGESEDLIALEENLFKELPAAPSTIKEERKNSRKLLPKKGALTGPNNVSSASVAKRKVLATQDVNTSGSKRSGCPRPVASSTLKRPAKVNTTRIATKELNVSKIPIRKSDPLTNPATVKKTTQSVGSSTQNQIVQPAVSDQRNSGLKCSSSSFKSSQRNARSGSESRSVLLKSSIQQAKRSVVHSALEIHSSTNSKHSHVTKTNDNSKTNRGPAFPASEKSSNNHDGVSNKVAISLPPKVPSSVGSLQHPQLQTAKPSGLRMPSPSLGFFNQSKASSPHSLLQRSNQACSLPESNVPDLRKFGALNAICETTIPSPAKIPNMVNGVTACSIVRIPGSVTEPSFPSKLNPGSLEKTNSNLHINGNREVELIVPSNSSNSDILNDQQSLHSSNDIGQKSPKRAEQSRNEKISHAEDNELHSSDNKLLLWSAPSDQLMKDDADERVSNVFPTNIEMELSGPELENPHSMSQHHQAGQVQGAVTTKDMIDNLGEEEKMSQASIKDHGAFSCSQSGDANDHNMGGTPKGRDGFLSCVQDVNEETRKQTKETLPCALQVEQDCSETTKPWLNNGTLSSKSRSSDFQKRISTNVADSSSEARCHIDGDFKSSYDLFNYKNTEEGKECISGVDDLCTESQLQSVHGISSIRRGKVVLCSSALDIMVVDDVNENISDANGSDSKSSSALCKQPALLESGFGMTVTVEHPHRDDALSGLNGTEFRHGISLHDQTISGLTETMDKYQKTDVVTASSNEVPDVFLNSGREYENSQCITSQSSTVVQVMDVPEAYDKIASMQVKVGSVIDYIDEHEDVEDGLCILPENNHHLQPGRDIIYSQQNTSTVHTNQLNFTHIVNNMSIEGKQIPEAYGELLFEECMPFEEPREFNSREVADVSLDAKSCGGIEFESSHALFQHDYEKQTNEEVAGVDDSIKKSILKYEEMHVLDGSLSVDSCGCKLNSSTVKNKSSLVFHHVQEQSGMHSELHNSDLVAAHISLDTHGLCLNDKLIVNNCSPQELQERIDCRSMVESDACGNELTCVVSNQVAPAAKNDGVDEGQKVEYPSGEDKVSGFVEIEPSGKTLVSCIDMKFGHDDGLNSPTCLLRSDVSLNMNDDGQILGSASAFNSKAFCSQTKESLVSVEQNQTLSSLENVEVDKSKSDVFPEEARTSQNKTGSVHEIQQESEDATCASEDATMSFTGSVIQDLNVNAMKSDVFREEATISQDNGSSIGEMRHESEANTCATEDATISLTGSVSQDVIVNAIRSDVLPEEVETIISQKDEGPNNEMHFELDGAKCAMENKIASKLLKKSGNDMKQNNLVIKPPAYAVPFSDEWLAAFEAAGEEILTMKRGAVQNSPPDRSQTEPGPWSPVKRKHNQGIGPYDCTKFTNTNPSTSSSSYN